MLSKVSWQWQGKTYEIRSALDEAKRRYYEAISARHRAQHLARLREGARTRREATVAARRRRLAVPVRAREEETASPQPAPEVRSPQPAVTVRPEKPDDLTRIRGIGAGTLYRLNRGGVWTFAQLARLTPEEIYELTGVRVELVIYGRLIKQARELA